MVVGEAIICVNTFALGGILEDQCSEGFRPDSSVDYKWFRKRKWNYQSL